MEEKNIVIIESSYESRKDVLLNISKELDFSNYSGDNLDAFWDCLSEIFFPVTFVIVPKKKYGCSNWLHEVCTLLKEMADERETIKVVCANIDNVEGYYSYDKKEK